MRRSLFKITQQPVHEKNLPTTNSMAFLNRVTLTVFAALIFCSCSSGAPPRQFRGGAQPSSQKKPQNYT